MIVKIIHDGVRVHGSHQGSLELLAGYLQKYGRMRENITVKVRNILTMLFCSP